MKILTGLHLAFVGGVSVRTSLLDGNGRPTTELQSSRRTSLAGILGGGLSLLQANQAVDTQKRSHTAVDTIHSVFPAAVTTQQLVSQTSRLLHKKYGYGKTTLVATSLCSDEVNRPLEQAFRHVYSDCFSLGGLAGFPFAGVTGYNAMAHHIPDNGSCLLVYGPHVGVNEHGQLGTVDRRGRQKGGACCGSAAAALGYVNSVSPRQQHQVTTASRTDPLDTQQAFVESTLLPYAARLQKADDTMLELPKVLFEVQDELLGQIIGKSAGAVSGSGKICLLGGIQINTPAGDADYFLPLRFDIRDSSGALLENLLLAL